MFIYECNNGMVTLMTQKIGFYFPVLEGYGSLFSVASKHEEHIRENSLPPTNTDWKNFGHTVYDVTVYTVSTLWPQNYRLLSVF